MNLRGKRALVFGVASEESIAWGITKKFLENGATVTLGYQKRFLSRIMQLVKDVEGIESYHEIDVAYEESVREFFRQLQGKYDVLVHCIGYAPYTALEKPILFTKQEDFETALVISSYSLLRLVRNATPYLSKEASVMALTYLGAVKVVPSYKVMGIAKAALESIIRELASSLGPTGVRVNGISAGPIPTIAAKGIPGFEHILKWIEKTAPLRRNVSQEDIGNLATFLASDMARNITGQIIYVDSGYSAMGVPPDLPRFLNK